MRRTKQLLGSLGLAIQVVNLSCFLVYFILARLGWGGYQLPLSVQFIRQSVGIVLLGTLVGAVGLIFDCIRLRAIVAVLLFLPILSLMGVLDGHF